MRAFPKPHALLAAAAEPGFIGIHLGRMLHLFVDRLGRGGGDSTYRLAAGLHRTQRNLDPEHAFGDRSGFPSCQPETTAEKGNARLEAGAECAFRRTGRHPCPSGPSALRAHLRPEAELQDEGLELGGLSHLADAGIQSGLRPQVLTAVLTSGGVHILRGVDLFRRNLLPRLSFMSRLATRLAATWRHGGFAFPAHIGAGRFRTIARVQAELALQFHNPRQRHIQERLQLLYPLRPIDHSPRLVDGYYKYQTTIHVF